MKSLTILLILSFFTIGCLSDLQVALDPNIEQVEFVELDLDPVDKAKIQEFWGIDQNYLESDGPGRLAYRSFNTPYGQFNALDPPIIIDSQEKFTNLFEKSPPEEVDFSEQIILGYKVRGGGCTSNPEVKMKKNILEKTIIFLPKLNDSGSCAMAIHKWFFVAFPKPENGYHIVIYSSR